jgi:hypothetical protein
MSSSKLGLKNDWVTGSILGADQMNDLHNTLDNVLGSAREICIPNGVISGWTIAATSNLNVAAGEGWVGGAHGVTSAPQAITGLTANTTNYVYASKKAAETGRVSTSLTLGEVNFVANTTGVVPANSVLLASGVVNAGGTQFASVNNSPAGKIILVTIPALLNGAPTFTIGAETGGTTINVAVQMKDYAGANLACKTMVRVWLSDAAEGAVTGDPPSGTVLVGTNGVIIDSHVAKVHLLVLTNATGAFDLNIIEAAGDTWYMNVEYQGKIYTSGAITFAA